MSALTTTKLLINLTNGQGIQTQTFSAADLAGVVNAGVQKIVTPVDLYTTRDHNIVVSQISDFYEVNV